MILAYEHKAELIVAVESYKHDRFWKRQERNGKYFLVRMKVGIRLSMPKE